MNPHVVWCVYGTRPEVIKMAPVVWALRARPEAIAVRLVFTGQHRELASDLFTPLAMEPDLALGVMTEDQSLTAVGARCLQAIGHALEQDAPALLLVQGDTSTVLFSALAAYFQKVAIGHVEAGLRSFNKYAPFPEEAMRRLTDAVADLHFAATPRAAANLRAEGVDPARNRVTGPRTLGLGCTGRIVRTSGCARANAASPEMMRCRSVPKLSRRCRVVTT